MHPGPTQLKGVKDTLSIVVQSMPLFGHQSLPAAQMPRTEDAAAESDSSHVTLCDSCSKALQKPLVCARCKTATYVPRTAR
jgi:uncharacterized paraquat-inducible protein A